MIIKKIIILFALCVFITDSTDNNTNTYSLNNNKHDLSSFLLNGYLPFNYTENKIKYINYITLNKKKNERDFLEISEQSRLCYLFKVFFDKQSYINYNDTMFMEVFSIIHENTFLTPNDLELYYIRNKCYEKVYESKIILSHNIIRNIILKILFMYAMRHNILFTISICFLYYLLF